MHNVGICSICSGPVSVCYGDNYQEIRCKQCGAVPCESNQVIQMMKAPWPAKEIQFPGQNPYYHRHEPNVGYKDLNGIEPFGVEAIHPIGLGGIS